MGLQLTNNSNIAAIVVAYFPDAAFPQRLHLLREQFPLIVVVDNGSQGDALEILLQLTDPGILLIRNVSNEGIAIALNQGLACAREHGYSNVVTFDQDSSILPNFLENLQNAWKSLGSPVTIIGSNYLDTHRANARHRIVGGLLCRETRTVISSGMFFPLALPAQIGGFLDELFIDGVDHEFCLRARKHGYKVWLLVEPGMRHEIGRPMDTSNHLLKRFLPYNHPPLRKYYIARNTLHNIRAYWKQEPLWCVKRTLAILLKFSVAICHTQRRKHLAALLLGLRDAWHNRLGKKELPAS
jgi:rhamnosyltransferase